MNDKLNNDNFDGVVIPVTVEGGRSDSFRILKQKKFSDYEFISSREFLYDFIRKLDLNDKKVFLSVISLFDALGGGGNALGEVRNLEILKRAIADISNFEDSIIINNDFYDNNVSRKEFFDKLKEKYPKIDYAYTTHNRLDSVYGFQNIVARNINGFYIVQYINEGKHIYLPQFERGASPFEASFEELLGYYYPDNTPRFSDYFQQADITVISKEKADKVLEKVLNNR